MVALEEDGKEVAGYLKAGFAVYKEEVKDRG